MEKYSQDQRSVNKDKGKLFGSADKALGAGITVPRSPCLTVGCSQLEHREKPKDQHARATKGHSSKEGV